MPDKKEAPEKTEEERIEEIRATVGSIATYIEKIKKKRVKPKEKIIDPIEHLKGNIRSNDSSQPKTPKQKAKSDSFRKLKVSLGSGSPFENLRQSTADAREGKSKAKKQVYRRPVQVAMPFPRYMPRAPPVPIAPRIAPPPAQKPVLRSKQRSSKKLPKSKTPSKAPSKSQKKKEKKLKKEKPVPLTKEGLFIIKPNAFKVALKNSTNLLVAVGVIVLIVVILHFQIGLDFFFDMLADVGITASPTWILTLAIFIAVATESALLLYNFLTVGSTKYVIYPDKLQIGKVFMLLLLRTKEISYQNIEMLTYHRDGILNKLFNSGTIEMEVIGEDEQKLKLEFIDNVSRDFEYLLNSIRKYIFIRQKEYEMQLLKGNSWKIKRK